MLGWGFKYNILRLPGKVCVSLCVCACVCVWLSVRSLVRHKNVCCFVLLVSLVLDVWTAI